MRRQSLTDLPRAFKFAANGLWLALTRQRNFRIHFLISALVLLLGVVLVKSAIELTILIFAVVLGLVAEMLNTTVEELVDLVSPDYSGQAKVAKDVAAGMVLLVAIGTSIVGVIILLPPILNLLG